jgi:hypothetical protein
MLDRNEQGLANKVTALLVQMGENQRLDLALRSKVYIHIGFKPYICICRSITENSQQV